MQIGMKFYIHYIRVYGLHSNLIHTVVIHYIIILIPDQSGFWITVINIKHEMCFLSTYTSFRNIFKLFSGNVQLSFFSFSNIPQLCPNFPFLKKLILSKSIGFIRKKECCSTINNLTEATKKDDSQILSLKLCLVKD